MRNTLTARAVLVTCTVALIAVAVTAAIGVPLAIRTAEKRDRAELVNEATLAAELLRPRIRNANPNDEVRAIYEIRRLNLDLYFIRGNQADRAGLPRSVVDRVASGGRVSGERVDIDGQPHWVEGRPIVAGSGVVVAKPVTRVTVDELLGQLLLPLLAGLVAGLIAGLLLARRLARPIRTAAAAATRLSAGERSVRVPVEPPAEAAELAQALNDLAAALAQSEGRQREFLMSISHELRTPLTTIKGYAEALADGVIGPDGGPRVGQTLLAEAERLDRLVADLLALARLEADDFPLESLPIDLANLVGACAEAWAGRCAEVGVVLRTEIAPGSWAMGDPGRLRQVLDGLIENALRVLPAGAPLVLAVHGPVVEVRDGGPGFTDADLVVAFQRGALNQRYRGIRQVGSGLGLALASRLVHRIGGTIEAGHAPEGGARFTVRLPAPPPALPAAPVGPGTAVAGGSVGPDAFAAGPAAPVTLRWDTPDR
jgi:two-component system sensor histidine kinase BaeS